MQITIDYLSQYTYLESEIKRIQRRIDYYKNNSLKAEHGVVKGSMNEFPYAQCHFVVSGSTIKSTPERDNKAKQLLIDLIGNKQIYMDMKLEIELFIETISDLEIKNIMTSRYVDGMTFEEIGDELGYDRTSISKKIDKFMENERVSHNSHM